MSVLLINANSTLIPLADKSVHMVATSPPYWGLRSYSTGDLKSYELGSEPLHDCYAWTRNEPPCGSCYVCNLRSVAAEIWRVLRDDGVFFLNLGDSYNGSGGAGGDYAAGGLKVGQPKYSGRNVSALKPKDLVGIPWRVALALQADGWYLRSGMPWVKRNAMPESASDRPNTAVEYIFLFSKSPRYFFDMDAVRVPGAVLTGQAGTFARQNGKNTQVEVPGQNNASHRASRSDRVAPGRNLRNSDMFFTSLESILASGEAMLCDADPLALVVNTSGWAGAHFATWPPALVEPMIKAGTSEYGVCAECGAPWERVVERTEPSYWEQRKNHDYAGRKTENKPNDNYMSVSMGRPENSGVGYKTTTTTGWRATCTCDAPTAPAIVLDPFAGSGTTGVVARQLGRNFVGLDLSYSYLHDQARARLELDKLDAWSGNGGASVAEQVEQLADLPLFGGQS